MINYGIVRVRFTSRDTSTVHPRSICIYWFDSFPFRRHINNKVIVFKVVYGSSKRGIHVLFFFGKKAILFCAKMLVVDNYASGVDDLNNVIMPLRIRDDCT